MAGQQSGLDAENLRSTIRLGEASAALNQHTDHVQEAVTSGPDRTGPVIHRALADFEELCRGAAVLAADDDSSRLAHPPQIGMQPADKADRAGSRRGEFEQNDAKSAGGISGGRWHEFVPDAVVCNACQGIA